MKKFILAAFAALFLVGCGVGTYSVASGRPDEAAISFVSGSKYDIEVAIDDATYTVQTVKTIDYKAKKNIKQTAKNTITMTPGKHELTVKRSGQVVYSKTIFVSVGEHKVVEL